MVALCAKTHNVSKNCSRTSPGTIKRHLVDYPQKLGLWAMYRLLNPLKKQDKEIKKN